MKPEKQERIIGYVLLIIGLILIFIPVWLALSMFFAGRAPQLIPTSTGQPDGFGEALVSFSNVCLIFFILLVVGWAGSIVSSRGIALIKEMKLRVTREALGENIEIKEDKPEKT